MPAHAFVNESKRGPYLMCAFVVGPAYRPTVAAELNRLRPAGAPRPDALAWTYGYGGDWRRRAAPVITDIVDVDQLQT